MSNLTIRPYIGVSGFCDTSLMPVAFNSSGDVISGGTGCGAQANFGAHGGHKWRTTTMGLDYSGDYLYYPGNRYYDGSDQSLSLGVSHRFSKHLELTLKETAGTYARSFILPTAAGFYDPYAFIGPTPELLDNRVYYLGTGLDLTLRQSARLSFNFGGEGYLVRRRSSSLYGVTGADAHADIAYRYSRFATIGATYSYDHMSFTKAFGSIDAHSIGLVYSLRLSAAWEFAATGGATRVESLALTRVAIDPLIAAITGQTSGVGVDYRLNYFPLVRVRLARKFRRGLGTAEYARAITPGNGYYAGAEGENAGVIYSYTGLRRWSLSAGLQYTRYLGLLQTAGKYFDYGGGIGVGRTLLRNISWNLRLDGRHDTVSQNHFNHTYYRVTMGFTWSPGDVPLNFW